MQYNAQNSWDLYLMTHGTRNALFNRGSTSDVRKPKAKSNKRDQEGRAEKLY